MRPRQQAIAPREWHPPQPDPSRIAAGNIPAASDLARDIAEIRDPERRSTSWFLHSAALRLGGFRKIAQLIPDLVPDVLGTSTMRELGPGARKTWTEAIARKVDQEINGRYLIYDPDASLERRTSESLDWPKDYEDAMGLCAERVERIGEALLRICRGNEERIDEHCRGSMLSVFEILAKLRREWQARASAQLAETSVVREVFGALDYACTCEPGITLIQGDPRTGKTASARTWCDSNAHRARYLSLESSMTDAAFFADVNRALGNPALMNYGLARLRQEIREVLDTRDLLLVIDEGQQLWSNARKAVPTKINWLMTAVVNRGCSIALVVTPQFMGELSRFEKDTAWAAAQWKGRIVNYCKLPSTLQSDEIKAVARHLFPEGDADAIRALVALASASPSYLQAIRTAVARARFHAGQEGIPAATKHIKRATGEQLGLLEDLAKATLPPATKSSRGRVSSLPGAPTETLSAASRLQGGCSDLPEPLAERSRPALTHA